MNLFGLEINLRSTTPEVPGVTETEPRKPADGANLRRKVSRAESPDLAMKLSVVFACVRVISETIARCPLKYQRYSPASESWVDFKEEFKDPSFVPNKIWYLVNVRPNKRQTAYQFKKAIVTEMLLQGNCYVVPKYVRGELTELIPVTADRGSVTYHKDIDTYDVSDNYDASISKVYKSQDILHFKNISIDGGFTGVSTIYYAATVLNIAATADGQTLDSFATGGMGKYLLKEKSEGGHFTFDGDDDEMKSVADDLQNQSDRDIKILRGDYDLDRMDTTANDQQFLLREEFNEKQIARFFGVSPSKIGGDGGSNYRSLDAANAALYDECLCPKMCDIECELNSKLLSFGEHLQLRFSFDTESLYLTNVMTKAEYVTKRVSQGSLTVNEARAMWNMPSVEGGDTVIVSAQMASIDSDKIQGNTPQQQQ